MAVFRVEKSRGYTVMSNHHLRNKELSLKAKGLLSQMLSLPEDWDYCMAVKTFCLILCIRPDLLLGCTRVIFAHTANVGDINEDSM